MTSTTNFGRDTSCTSSLRTGRFVTGARLVGEAAWRRLNTRRGLLRGGEKEANYGIDLSELVGSVQAKSDEAALPGRIQSELEKDERIDSVAVSVLATTTTAGLVSFEITIDAETKSGPFQLVIAASAVTVDLLRLTTEDA